MPEKRLAKARETLPAGFQFGDGYLPMALMWRIHEWRVLCQPGPALACRVLDDPMPESPALLGRSYIVSMHWNTIEPE